MRILLIEDDALLGDGIMAGLKQAGHTVDWLRDGIAAESALNTDHFDAVVLDINLPRQDGLSLLKKRRAAGDSTPVLLLTARDTVADRVRGLDAGADDYLVKPFALDELAARLRALIRRGHGRPASLIEHGELSIDPAEHTVQRNGAPVELSPREFALLSHLLEHRGQVQSRAQLETALYGWSEDVDSNAVEVHVHHLRKKLGTELIRTIRGVGYLVPKPKS
ncbi:response regulator [Chitinivorax sp. PXF-14]|uniref:response regulator n=1 Tax=Chitinivorax sp. PXF-14 TaxID=3230488 RepID=UPI003466761C